MAPQSVWEDQRCTICTRKTKRMMGIPWDRCGDSQKSDTFKLRSASRLGPLTRTTAAMRRTWTCGGWLRTRRSSLIVMAYIHLITNHRLWKQLERNGVTIFVRTVPLTSSHSMSAGICDATSQTFQLARFGVTQGDHLTRENNFPPLKGGITNSRT